MNKVKQKVIDNKMGKKLSKEIEIKYVKVKEGYLAQVIFKNFTLGGGKSFKSKKQALKFISQTIPKVLKYYEKHLVVK